MARTKKTSPTGSPVDTTDPHGWTDDPARSEPVREPTGEYNAPPEGTIRGGLEKLKQMCDITDAGVEARKLEKPSEFLEQVLQTQVSVDVCNLRAGGFVSPSTKRISG
eukprot:7770425-Pyramimonas_sp.AAC.1